MAEIVIFTNVERQFQRLEQARKILENDNLSTSSCKSVFFGSESCWNKNYEHLVSSASVVLFCWQGAISPNDLSTKSKMFLQSHNTKFAMLSITEPEVDDQKGFQETDLELIRQYIAYSGLENYKQLWLWLQAGFTSGQYQYKRPATLPWHGICNFSGASPSAAAQKAVIGILFSRENWIWQETAYLQELVKVIEAKEMQALPVFCLWSDNEIQNAPGVSKAVKQYFYKDGRCIVDAVINTFKVGLTQSSLNEKDFLKKLNVPVLQGYNLLREYGQWWDSFTGMDPVELSCNVVQPEFDGVLHGLPLSSKEADVKGIAFYAPIQERIEKFVAKAEKWAVLHAKNNSDKKIAIIFHNYPPTNDSIGSAQGLDSPASVAALLKKMQADGYQTGSLPQDGQQLIEMIVAGVTNDRRFLTEAQMKKAVGSVAKKDYCDWFERQDPLVQVEMEREWGPAPGNVFYYGNKLLIPGIESGNIYVGMQPPRGFGEEPGKIIHSPVCPPPHHYLAFYGWLRDIWQADAVIHVGTHGSLEWLPGKNAGLSCKCYPDLALGDLPDIYPYYVTIVGEGIQAKRRGAACLIGHLNPPSSHADTYEELAELEKLLDEYAQFKVEHPASVGIVEEQIIDKIAEMHLDEDIPRHELDADSYILKIHAYVEQLKHMQIRTGLHILGKAPEGEELLDFILVLTRVENSSIPSLPQTIAAAYGFDYYELEARSGEVLANGQSGAALIDKIWNDCKAVIQHLQAAAFSKAGLDSLLEIEAVQVLSLSEAQQEKLKITAAYICDVIAPNLALTRQEITNTLRALNGEYIEPGPGGAPTSGRADILPTGRNFFGVDPNNLPTPAAWELGKLLADQVIARYISEENKYPESIGIVLWSDSNMRSNGQCIAEFLYLLGVKPVWQRGSQRVIDLEIISLAELQRPRIDIMARISGLFRDSMAAAVELLEQAVEMAAGLDETTEENFVKKHIQSDAEALAREGLTAEEAVRQASYRIFGCPPGGYGAGVAHLIEEKNWENIADLADVYVRWGAHAYGKNNNGDFVPQLFRRRLSNIDITIKNMDNHEVHLLNSDDFNAYCGGMNAAVRSIRGKMPKCYIGDSADKAHTETKSLDEEFRRVFRGESMNPKYLEGMKKHGYKGASDLAALVAHAYGWDVTSSVMEDWMYEGFAGKLVLDEDMRQWMQEVNPWALQRITEKLLEAEQRQLWSPLPETKAALEKIYLNIEGELEEKSDF